MYGAVVVRQRMQRVRNLHKVALQSSLPYVTTYLYTVDIVSLARAATKQGDIRWQPPCVLSLVPVAAPFPEEILVALKRPLVINDTRLNKVNIWLTHLFSLFPAIRFLTC